MGELCAEELVGLAELAGNVVGRGRRGAMSNRRRGRFSVPDPRVPLSFPAMDVLKQAQTLF